MKLYPKYKDVGEEWFGEVPNDWGINKVKYLSRYINQPINTNDLKGKEVIHYSIPNVQEYGMGVVENGNDIDSSKLVLDDSLLVLSKLNPRKSTVCLVQNHENQLVVGSGEFIPLKFTDNREFRYYQLIDKRFTDFISSQVESVTKSHQRIRPELLFNCYLPVPSQKEQFHIVNFLDQKTSIIDDLIQKKLRKIELLKEQRTSLINHTVTKGLNPDVKMKDSGVEWIGGIPEHWVLSKFKYESSIPVKYGLNISGDSYKEEGIRFIRITDLTEEGELIETNGKYLDENQVPVDFLLNKYDVLFCRSGHTVGKSYLHFEEGNYTSGGYLVRFNFRTYPESKFIFYVGKTKYYWDWIKLNTIISTIENVNGDKYQNFQFPQPPIPEQQQIVQYLDQKTTEIDTTITLEHKKIDLLKEYRQSLISEVVTGKIDVRQN